MGLCVVMCGSMQSSAEAMCIYLPCMSMYIRFVLQLCIIMGMHLACLKYHERLCISKVTFCRVYPHRHKYILNGDAGVAAG